MIIRLNEENFDFAEADVEVKDDDTITFKTKYASPIINLANGFSQATRPSSMGFSLNEYIQEYSDKIEDKTIDSWKEFLRMKNKDLDKEIGVAATKIIDMLKNFEKIIKKMDKGIVTDWVSDLLFLKTFNGFHLQNIIIESVAKKLGYDFRLGNKEEESKGIDGYIGDQAVSIKPLSYKSKVLQEKIECKMIYYTKLKDGSYDVEFNINPKIIFYHGRPIKLKYHKGDVITVQEAIKLHEGGFNAIEGSVFLKGKADAVLLRGKVPLYVTGNYNMSNCNLQTIERMCPVSVLGDEDFSKNGLLDLKGADEYIGGDFIISDNPIKLWHFSPEIVGKDFVAINCGNAELDSTKISTLIRGSLITKTEKTPDKK